VQPRQPLRREKSLSQGWRRAGLAGAFGVALTFLAGPALAQTDPCVVSGSEERVCPPGLALPDTEVLGEQQVRPAAVQAAAQESLPVTGGDLAGLAVIGAGAMGVGTVLVRRSRRTA
jgi:hypothetical protein